MVFNTHSNATGFSWGCWYWIELTRIQHDFDCELIVNESDVDSEWVQNLDIPDLPKDDVDIR